MHNIPDFLRITPEMQEHFAKGGMIKRADGSYSRRGLWDNIRANKGSGRKPTKQMLEQERKIKAKEYEVGGSITFTAGGEKHRVYEKESPTGNGEGVQGHIMVNHPTMDKGKWDTIDLTEKSGARTVAEGVAATKQWHEENPEYGNGGYTVRRSHDRKGKTHVVIGPDGTKKYFGDPNMGERGKSKYGKEAFYARHAKNLKNNPYFRAYARATWADGGEVPESDIFNNWKKQNNFNPDQWWQDQIMKDPSRNISTGPEIGPVLSNYDDPFHSWNIPSRGSVESMTPPTFSDGGSYGPFYGRRDAAKLQRWRNPTADSMTPSFFAMGGLNKYQSGTTSANPFKKQLTSQNEVNSDYSPYSNNSSPWSTDQPATLNTGQPVGVLAQGQDSNNDPSKPSFYNRSNQNSANTGSANAAIANDDFQLPGIMGNEGYGQNMKVSTPVNRTLQYESMTNDGSAQKVSDDKAAISQNLANQFPDLTIDQGNTSTPASTPQNGKPFGMLAADNKNVPFYQQTPTIKNATAEETKEANNSIPNADNDKLNHYLAGERLAFQGVSKLPYGLANMARTVTSLNTNSPQNASSQLAKRFMADSTNSTTVYGNFGRENQGGVKYSKYGGNTMYKEGEVVDLSFEQIKKLKDQGYDFQYL